MESVLQEVRPKEVEDRLRPRCQAVDQDLPANGPAAEPIVPGGVCDEDREAGLDWVRETQACCERNALPSLQHTLRHIEEGLEPDLGRESPLSEDHPPALAAVPTVHPDDVVPGPKGRLEVRKDGRQMGEPPHEALNPGEFYWPRPAEDGGVSQHRLPFGVWDGDPLTCAVSSETQLDDGVGDLQLGRAHLEAELPEGADRDPRVDGEPRLRMPAGALSDVRRRLPRPCWPRTCRCRGLEEAVFRPSHLPKVNVLQPLRPGGPGYEILRGHPPRVVDVDVSVVRAPVLLREPRPCAGPVGARESARVQPIEVGHAPPRDRQSQGRDPLEPLWHPGLAKDAALLHVHTVQP